MDIKKLKSSQTKEYLEDFIGECESLGHEFIELMFKTPTPYTEFIMGVEEARVNERRNAGSNVVTTSSVYIIKDGSIVFYPDAKGRAWGYLLDTPKNRQFLAEQLVSPVVHITDKQIRNNITQLAIKLGKPHEEALHKDHSIDGYIPEKVKDKQTIDELRAELAAIKAEKEELENRKPLANVKPTKRPQRVKTKG